MAFTVELEVAFDVVLFKIKYLYINIFVFIYMLAARPITRAGHVPTYSSRFVNG